MKSISNMTWQHRKNISISAFVVLFLLIFTPFDIQQWGYPERLYYGMGYGLCTLLGMYGWDVLKPTVAYALSGGSPATRQIIYSFSVVLIISLFNFVYSFMIGVIDLSLESFLFFAGITLAVGVFPSVWLFYEASRKEFSQKEFSRKDISQKVRMTERRIHEERVEHPAESSVTLRGDNQDELLPEAGDENLPESAALDEADVQPYLGTYKIANPRNQLFEGPQKLLNFVQLKLVDDTLRYQPFQGESQALIPLSDSLYRMEDYRRGHILLTKNQEGVTMLVNADSLGPVYRQTSTLGHQVLLYSVIFSMLLLVSTIPAGLIRLIRQMMGIRKPGRSRIYFLFSAALISLFLTVAAISTIGYDSLYDLGNVSLLSLSIFIFPLLFFLLGLAAVYFSIKKIRSSGALLSSYLVLLSIAFVEVSLLLWDWHLLGLMIWRW